MAVQYRLVCRACVSVWVSATSTCTTRTTVESSYSAVNSVSITCFSRTNQPATHTRLLGFFFPPPIVRPCFGLIDVCLRNIIHQVPNGKNKQNPNRISENIRKLNVLRCVRMVKWAEQKWQTFGDVYQQTHDIHGLRLKPNHNNPRHFVEKKFFSKNRDSLKWTFQQFFFLCFVSFHLSVSRSRSLARSVSLRLELR